MTLNVSNMPGSEGAVAFRNVGAYAPTYYRRNTDAIPTSLFAGFLDQTEGRQ